MSHTSRRGNLCKSALGVALLASPVHPRGDGRDELTALGADEVVNQVRLGRELAGVEHAFEPPQGGCPPRRRADEQFVQPLQGVGGAVDVLHRPDAHGVAVHDIPVAEPPCRWHLPVKLAAREEGIGVCVGLLLPLVPQLVDVGVMEQELGGICRGE